MDFIPQLIEDITVLSPFKPEMFDLVISCNYRNYEALRAAFPTIEVKCYIQKPIEIKDLVRRINAELEQ